MLLIACSGEGATTTTTELATFPRRIVSLSATHTEMLYAIGAADQIAATDLTSNYPPEAQETTKVDAFNFNVEEVVSLDPDLVVLAFDFNGEVDALAAAGVESLLLAPPPDLSGALDQLSQLGDATGNGAEAARLAADLEGEIQDIIDNAPRTEPAPTFFHEIDATLFTANSSTYLGSLFADFGLVNIADEVPDEFASGYVQLSGEFILDSNPDLIFLGDAAFGESLETVAARPGWGSLSAVQEGNVFDLDADISGRWGPRTLDLVAQIAQALEAIS